MKKTVFEILWDCPFKIVVCLVHIRWASILIHVFSRCYFRRSITVALVGTTSYISMWSLTIHTCIVATESPIKIDSLSLCIQHKFSIISCSLMLVHLCANLRNFRNNTASHLAYFTSFSPNVHLSSFDFDSTYSASVRIIHPASTLVQLPGHNNCIGLYGRGFITIWRVAYMMFNYSQEAVCTYTYIGDRLYSCCSLDIWRGNLCFQAKFFKMQPKEQLFSVDKSGGGHHGLTSFPRKCFCVTGRCMYSIGRFKAIMQIREQ